MSEQDILKAWLCIKSAPEIRGREMIRLLQTWGDPCEFVGNPGHDLYRDDSFKAAGLDYLANYRLPENHLQITKLAETYEIKVLGYTDPDYPLGLKEIYSPPPVLYYRGDLLTALDAKCLAVVGTRKPSALAANVWQDPGSRL
jgi:DNA processing protein